MLKRTQGKLNGITRKRLIFIIYEINNINIFTISQRTIICLIHCLIHWTLKF